MFVCQLLVTKLQMSLDTVSVFWDSMIPHVMWERQSYRRWQHWQTRRDSTVGLGMDHVKHTGACHCGAVRFEVWNSPDLLVFDCDCSICTKKQNRHFIVPKNQFTLLQGWDHLTTYTFNTHAAKHTFCRICGVQSFYTPRSNPDGYGVAPHCLDTGTVRSVTVEKFCGKKWEESMQNHQTIKGMSKT
uniref:CENP-V/GFA domain-containing protein n=2 Tax=Oncorhynchus tshawytscha TaxID=74940 RepID=A0A8C8IAX9_ONCTS